MLPPQTHSMRRSRTGLTMKSKALMASTVRRITGSETGSTVMPSDNSSLETRGSCPRDSMWMSCQAKTSATRVTIPRSSLVLSPRNQRTKYHFGPLLGLRKIGRDLDEIRNYDCAGCIATSAAAVKHLRTNFAARHEDCIVHILHSGQQRLTTDHPWVHRHLDARFGILRRTN